MSGDLAPKPPALPLPLRAANRLDQGLGALGIGLVSLRPERALAEAARRTGLPARLDPDVEDALERLCRSATDEANLHLWGRVRLYGSIVEGLAGLLRLDAAFARAPELARVPLVPPLVVTGLPRSGTTFLQRLLAAAPDARSIPFYEGLRPVPPDGPDQRLAAARADIRLWHWSSRAWGLEAMHHVSAEEPEECRYPIRIRMQSFAFWMIAPVYSYIDWLFDQDMRAPYRTYRRLLQLIQAGSPGKRLVLKCPMHLHYLPALREALPEALLVETHRDPLEMAASGRKLILALHGVSTRALDVQRTAEMGRRRGTLAAEGSVTQMGDSAFHLDYRQLVADPVASARAVYAHHGLPFQDEHASELARYAGQNRQHRYGRNRYSPEEHGIDEATLRRCYGAYREQYHDRFGGPG